MDFSLTQTLLVLSLVRFLLGFEVSVNPASKRWDEQVRDETVRNSLDERLRSVAHETGPEILEPDVMYLGHRRISITQLTTGMEKITPTPMK